MRSIGFCLACLLVATTLALAGCGAEGPEAHEGSEEGGVASPIPGATVLASGQQLVVDDPEPEFLVIADEGAWTAFWQTYAPEGRTESPPVDFDRSFVLVGIQGVKSTGGYEISFTDLKVEGDQVVVVADLEEPAAGEPAETALTQPYTIVQVDAERVPSGGELTFVFEMDDGQELDRVTGTIGVNPDVASVGERGMEGSEPSPVPRNLVPNRDLAPEAGSERVQPPVLGEAFPGGKILAQGVQLQYEEPGPRFLVITEPDAWTQFWLEFAPGGQKTAPELDFSGSFALVGLQGSKSTGGYSIEFTGLEQEGPEVQVFVQLGEPDPRGMVEPAFTQPYVIVEVDSTLLDARGPLTFVFLTEAGEELGRISHTIP